MIVIPGFRFWVGPYSEVKHIRAPLEGRILCRQVVKKKWQDVGRYAASETSVCRICLKRYRVVNGETAVPVCFPAVWYTQALASHRAFLSKRREQFDRKTDRFDAALPK